MDETRIDYRRTIAGCVAVIALLGAAFLLGRCSAPAEAQESVQDAQELVQDPAPTLDAATAAGYDFSDNAGRALVDLEVFLDSVTTTSTIAQKPAQNSLTATTQTSNPSDLSDRWDRLAQCETGGNWAANTGNGYGGGLQFAHTSRWSTWLSFGGGDYAAHPWDASREQQIDIAERVLATSGWRAWPGCSRKFGWL